MASSLASIFSSVEGSPAQIYHKRNCRLCSAMCYLFIYTDTHIVFMAIYACRREKQRIIQNKNNTAVAHRDCISWTVALEQECCKNAAHYLQAPLEITRVEKKSEGYSHWFASLVTVIKNQVLFLPPLSFSASLSCLQLMNWLMPSDL